MKKMDTLQRRIRYAGRQPRRRQVCLTERDLATFEVLAHHGPLPSHYLYAFTKHLAIDLGRHAKRLTTLYHEGYLRRPPQQWHSADWRCNSIVYDLSDLPRQLLSEDACRHAAPRTDPMHHRMMTATITASIELAATSGGHRFISQEKIIAHPKCPQSTKNARDSLRLPIGQRTLVPDALFGVQYTDGRYRFFALEADRNTEAIEQRSRHRNAYGKKFDAYIRAQSSGAFREHWGVPNLCVLTVTASVRRMRNMLEHLKQRAGRNQNSAGMFLFQSKTEFGPFWIVPPVMYDLFEKPWERFGDSIDISRS